MHNRRRVKTVRLSKGFQTVSPSKRVRLTFAPTCASLNVFLDDQLVASAEPYAPIQNVELTMQLRPGSHRISVQAVGVPGPSAFYLDLDLEFADGVRTAVFSDGSWSNRFGSPAKDLGKIDQRLIIPEDRRVAVDVVDNYEQWKQAIDATEGTDPASFFSGARFRDPTDSIGAG